MRVGNRGRAAVWLLMVVAVLAGGPLLDGALGLRCPYPLACRVAGAALLLAVLRGAAVTGRYLAVYGRSSCRLPRGEVDRLVTVGPYSCMRHPMHFFLAWFPLSLGLLEASPGAAAVGLVEAVLVLAMAVTVDERDALARFGEAYLEYRRRVPAFNPSPRCLAKALGRRPPRKRCRRG